MGNEIKLNDKKDTILWIDANVNNYENKETYKSCLKKFEKFNFIVFSSVKEAINFIKDNDYFEFRLFYVIVSGRLAENFFNEYVQLSEKKNIVAATIVYCYNQKLHEKKPYFKDRFLNPGGITNYFGEVIEYILRDECNWEQIPKRFKGYMPEKEVYGNVFMNIDASKDYELALPILIGKLINASFLEKEEIRNFQELLLCRYCYKINEINYLIKPSGNKNMDIPHHLITKFFLRLYTYEFPKYYPCFYKDINKDLTNDKFDDYHPFIFLLYDALNKGTVKSYKDNYLYRIGNLSNKEFKEMCNIYLRSQKDKSLKALYYSKNFLSFSKDKDESFIFLENAKDCTSILFIIQKPKNKDFFVTNIDIETFSSFKKEKEVLFLPLSCFEIIEIGSEKQIKKNNTKYKYRKVKLKYLEEYEKEINSKIEKIKGTDEINKFFENSLKSKYGEDVQKYYNKKDKFSIKYCQYINASPENNFFLNKIGTGFIHKFNKYLQGNNDAQIHIDDEIPNIINDENKIKKFFIDLLKNLDNKDFDQIYSIGICLGNFIYNWNEFCKAPTSVKSLNLAFLALAIGLPLIKLFPQIKENILKIKVFSIGTTNINISTLLNGLNILYAVVIEFFSIFSFAHQNKMNVTGKYILKRGIKLSIGVGFSFFGNLALKGILVLCGVTVYPEVTFVLGILTGFSSGILGAWAGGKLTDKIFGKDEFVLTSDHLYYKYIPNKYRRLYCNPNLKWNKTYLCTNVKSYVIECIANETDLVMLLINIPNDVYEIDECLGLNNNNIDDDNSSVSTENNEEESVIKITKKGKFIGDLITPYQGIKDNCYNINFIIYGINKDKINSKDWLYSLKNEKTIEKVFYLSVF